MKLNSKSCKTPIQYIQIAKLMKGPYRYKSEDKSDKLYKYKIMDKIQVTKAIKIQQSRH